MARNFQSLYMNLIFFVFFLIGPTFDSLICFNKLNLVMKKEKIDSWSHFRRLPPIWP